MSDYHIAIYELVAVVLALPLSYILAYITKKWVQKATAYQKHLDHLFITHWNGRRDDEYYAWQRVRFIVLSESPSDKELKYITKQLKSTDKNTYLSGSYVNNTGNLNINEDTPIIKIDE